MNRVIIPKDIEVVVSSYGGSGSTFLLRYLSQYKKTNDPDDLDEIKHQPMPPISLNTKVKYVYIFGNPKRAAISLFRRNYQYGHSMKTQSMGKIVSPIPKEMNLQTYASLGVDGFHFRNHFYNWYNDTYRIYSTMFLRYEKLFENIGLLIEFLELPTSAIDNFPKKKERFSDNNISAKILKQLNRMYEPFNIELSKLKDIEIKRG